MTLHLSKIAARRAISTAIMAAILGTASPASAQTEPAPKYNFVVKNARNIEASAVRFVGGQGTQNMPNIVLLGGSKEIWPKIKGGIQDAEIIGCPIRAILIGPTNVTPSLEIYAKGRYVTNPINPNEISQKDLTKLICDVNKEFYPK